MQGNRCLHSTCYHTHRLHKFFRTINSHTFKSLLSVLLPFLRNLRHKYRSGRAFCYHHVLISLHKGLLRSPINQKACLKATRRNWENSTWNGVNLSQNGSVFPFSSSWRDTDCTPWTGFRETTVSRKIKGATVHSYRKKTSKTYHATVRKFTTNTWA